MPVIAAKYNWLPQLNYPLDFNKTFRGRRVFGAHKTWRGLIIGVIFGSITGLFLSSLFAGGLLGVGALVGDAVKSFFKRQLKIDSGHPWFPFDQVDYILSALLVAWFIFPLTFAHVITALLIFGFGSYLVSYLGVKLKIKKSL